MEKVTDNVYIERGFGNTNVGHKLTREEATHGVDLLDRFPPPQERLGGVEECYRLGLGGYMMDFWKRGGLRNGDDHTG